MKTVAVLARVFLCLAFFAGGGASAFAQNMSVLLQQAEQGNAIAQNQIGWEYYEGKALKEDLTQAKKWNHLAAGQGSSNAQAYLGWAYSTGSGVKKDFYKAYIWYSLAGEIDEADEMKEKLTPDQIRTAAAEIKTGAKAIAAKTKVNAKALAAKTKADLGVFTKSKTERFEKEKVETNFNAGKKLEEGDRVLPNYKQAASLYKLAAKQGHAGAQERLGLMYLNGKGVARDYSEAYIWLVLAALVADGDKEDLIKQRQVAEENMDTDEINDAQAKAAKRLEEIKKATQ